jgi:hypothetical protein
LKETRLRPVQMTNQGSGQKERKRKSASSPKDLQSMTCSFPSEIKKDLSPAKNLIRKEKGTRLRRVQMTKKKYSIPSGVFSLEPGQKKRKRKSSSSPKDLQSKT